jgi:hypothetical protein
MLLNLVGLIALLKEKKGGPDYFAGLSWCLRV